MLKNKVADWSLAILIVFCVMAWSTFCYYEGTRDGFQWAQEAKCK